MPQDPRQSSLIDSVKAFDAELERFGRAAAAAEVSLQARAQDLLVALRDAQGEQQTRAEALRARASEIKERVTVYEQLANRYQELGAEGATLAEAAGKLSNSARVGGDSPPLRAELLDGLVSLEEKVTELRVVARTLAGDSRTAGFEDLASESHAVEQTLSALRNKLMLAR